MRNRPIVIRSFLIVLALGLAAVVGMFVYESHVHNDSAVAVRVAIDEYLGGQEPTNLTFLTEELGVSEPLDLAQFLSDVRTGYEVAPGPKWMNVYDVEIHTTNGRRYVASPIWSTTHWPDGEKLSEWSIACCELRD